jgi:adenosylhomocysteine nucleosidase
METSEAGEESGFHFYAGSLAGHSTVLLCSGVGKVNAARAAQFLADRFSPSHLIMCGVAGGLSGELSPGDVVVATELTFHDAGMLLAEGRFVPTGVSFLDGEGELVYRRSLKADERLVAMAMKAGRAIAAEEQRRPFRMVEGTVTTGDQAVFCSDKKASLREEGGAVAVEMEGAALAQVAQACGIPFAVIRSVSDLADETVGMELSWMIRYADDGPGESMGREARATRGFLGKPGRLTRALRLRRNVKMAAENAARVTVALVSELP